MALLACSALNLGFQVEDVEFFGAKYVLRGANVVKSDEPMLL